MKKGFSVLLLLLAACAPRQAPVPSTDSPTSQVQVAVAGKPQPTLLGAYWIEVRLDRNTSQTSVTRMRYTPRQFDKGLNLDTEEPWVVDDPGNYRGWDALILQNTGTYASYYGDLLFLRLNRPAKLGVIWYANPDDRPSWMAGWERGSEVKVAGKTFPVFHKTFRVGDHWLGGMQAARGRVYTVLFAEADGTPSKAPSVPPGLEVPKPNTACPAWVHDQYIAEGPDGKIYRTWHPQVDPIYWCYFGHEHGSDPRQFVALDKIRKPAFRYVSEKAKADEPHEGFKIFVHDQPDGIQVMSQFHMGSGGRARLCVRFHEYNIWFADKKTGELLAELHWMADTGASVNPTAEKRYKPADCPNNLDIKPFIARRIPQFDTPGYESWQLEFPTNLGFIGQRVYVTDNPRTVCSNERDSSGNPTCNTLIQDNRGYAGGPSAPFGENRWFTIPESVGFGFDATKAMATEVFYTDPFGKELRKADDPDAIRQYIKPGFKFFDGQPKRFIPHDMWWVEYRPIFTPTAPMDSHNIELGLGNRN